ncbi:E3 ubiquitin-protein ligase TRIM21-like [Diretmus argenteus]
MASANSLLTEDQFLCSICLDVFTNPSAIPCGHNFCLHCITEYWDTIDICQCPLCNEKFHKRPMLRVNTFIAEVAAKFKKSVRQKSNASPDQPCTKPEHEDVLCDLCTGAKLPALKSCLVCLMSYCPTHLEPHQRILALNSHKLINPVENLESMICKKHYRPLELFCKVDHVSVCESCTEKDHKAHKTVTLEAEFQRRKVQLRRTEAKMDKMMQDRQQKIFEIGSSTDISKNNAEKVMSYSKHVMTALAHCIQRSQAELTEVIEERQRRSEKQADGFIKELEGEIMQLMQKSADLKQISVTEDPLQFLQSSLSLNVTPPQTKDWSDVSVESDQYAVGGAVAQLQLTVMRELRLLCDPDLKKMQQHAVDVILDPDTANLSLTVSEDGKQVKHGDRKGNIPNKPERFDHVLNVLAKEGFSSGKFYYEVQVKAKTQWDLGVAKESINKKGDIRLSPKNGYWTIWLRKGSKYTANTGPAVILPLREKPQKVGVFVDYEGGQVSFYDAEARAHIYSFTGCTFTGKLFPFFSPCANDGGKNSAPLIITPVKYNG